MDSPYDIYDSRQVDAMKAENADLWRRYEQVVRENAELSERLDRYRRARAHDYGWKNDYMEVKE